MLIRKSVWMARGSTPAIVVIGNQVTRCLKKPRGVFVSVAWMIRRSCFITYQLAVVVDDLAQGVTQVVRGADLLDSTARQIALVEALNGRVPTYAHIPIVTNPAGEKLSKQTRAAALPTVGEQARVAALWHALSFLGQSPPDALMRGGVETLWQWAAVHWSIERVPKQRSGGAFPKIPE